MSNIKTMLGELFILTVICLMYFIIYVEIKVNKSNVVTEFSKEMTRQNINNEILLKLPFYFNGMHLNSSVDTHKYECVNKNKEHKYKEFRVNDEPHAILKPPIKHKYKTFLYLIKPNGKLFFDSIRESINYYFIRNGTANIYLIHPKFKDNFTTNNNSRKVENYIRKSHIFKHLKCIEGTILYVPNDWTMMIDNNEVNNCLIEKITFSTIINELLMYFKNILNNK